jgi:transposase
MTIARLVRDGRYFEPYLPDDIYAELRVLSNTRISVRKRYNALKVIITAILDEYFPELVNVFKNPLKSKTARQILRSFSFPSEILKLSEADILIEIRKVVKRAVGLKKVNELIVAASSSIGVCCGLKSTNARLNMLLDELELVEKQLLEIEVLMKNMLESTGYFEQLLSIKGIGVVTAASFLGEIGNPLRFSSARQISNYAGYNLKEDSSGKSKSRTCISKRGRKQLRSVLYQMSVCMVAINPEMKIFYEYLKTRKNNPLKKKQVLVAISNKMITVIYSILKKDVSYESELVFGSVRRKMFLVA